MGVGRNCEALAAGMGECDRIGFRSQGSYRLGEIYRDTPFECT